MNKPHIHAEIIKAWADGADIQLLFRNDWIPDKNPSWNSNVLYRVKPPPPELIVQWITINRDGYIISSNQRASLYGYRLMRLEIDPMTFTATCVLEVV